MKKTFLGIYVFFAATILFAQEKIEWINIDEIVNQTIRYESEGEYEKALIEISKIPQKDSIYISSLTSKALYLIKTGQFEEAVKVTEEGLKANTHTVKYYFMLNNAAAYLGLEKYQTAIDMLDYALRFYPKNSLIYYNKGLAYEGLKNFEEASIMYQIAITYNPFHANSHLKLGSLCYNEHHITQAMMCLSMYLLINPDGDNAFNILKAYNDMVEVKNEIERHPGIELSADDSSFEEIDLIINNYAALNKKYKLKSKIDLAIIRQNQVMIEKLNEYEGNGGFWERYYVPFYRYIDKNELFDIYAYTIAFSIQNEKYKTMIDKKIPQIKDFITQFQSQWVEIVGKNEVIIDGEKKQVQYSYNKSKMAGLGVLNNDLPVGKWEFYNEFGGLSSVGVYDDEGKEKGKWIFYNTLGSIVKKAEYDQGNLTNEYFYYYDNGLLSTYANYKEGKLNGKYEKFNENGALTEQGSYNDDLIEGEFIVNHDLGEGFPNYKVTYVKGLFEDTLYKYFPDGNIESKMFFRNNLREGPAVDYFHNGKIELKKNFVNNMLNGEYIEYYSNGNLYHQGTYLEGERNGVWKTYFFNGICAEESTYTNGKINGIMKTFDPNGNLYSEYTYRKGEIIAYVFYNKKHEVIKEAKKQKGEFYYEGYSSEGNIIAEGMYDISGGKEGEWKFYNSNHVLTSKGFYIEGMLQGDETYFYPNGEIRTVYPYKNDSLVGYKTTYYPNGQLKEQGWYYNDNLEGEWRTYFPNGTLESINYYSHGKLNGTSRIYAVDGKILSEFAYQDGRLMNEYYYIPDGKVFQEVDVDSSNKNLVYNYPNGNIHREIALLHKIKHGKYVEYRLNGKPKVEGNFFNGERNGLWKWYNEQGSPESIGLYSLGARDSLWTVYYDNGQIKSETHYRDGVLEGTNKFLNEKGIVTLTKEYLNDELHGATTFYSEEGKLQLVRDYNFGRLIGYSYLDNQSKLIPMISIENESVKIMAYFDNGKVSRELEYVNGEFNGSYKEYYSTGQICEEVEYYLGDRVGQSRLYFPDGTTKEERYYENDRLTGDLKVYHPNGQLKMVTPYIHGVENGNCKTYDNTGKLISETVYFDGEVFSENIY